MVSENGCRPKAEEKSSTPGAPREERNSLSEKRSPAASLSSGKRIREVLRHGSRLNGKSMSLMYLRREADEGPRVAVVAPKRTGNAVRRNKIRRILKEEFRLERRLAEAPIDVVLMWRGVILDPAVAAAAAHEETSRLLGKIRL